MMEITIPITRTKIILPRRRSDILSRPRLLSLFDDLVEQRLVIVAAPAGYGKTSLLIDYAHQSAMPVCWLSLDVLDGEVQRFAAYFIASIQTGFPEFGKTCVPALNSTPQERLNLDTLVSLIVNDLYDTIGEHFVLIIDDYHLVENNREINYFINRFLLLMDENCHLIISSRRLLPLADMPLLVARSQVGGLGFEDLAFQHEEIRNLYLQNFHILLPDAQADELVHLTEGWITGLILSTQVENGKVVTRFKPRKVAGISLYDYLAQQVLEQQTEPLRRFLYRTSLFEEFDVSICSAVIGKALGSEQDWQSLMDQVQRNNLFVLPLIEEEHIWLRYHHMFREFLQNRMIQEFPEEARTLQLRLADYYQQVGEWERAYQVYDRLGEKIAKANMVENAGTLMVSRGRILTLQTWLEDIPNLFVERSPNLLSLQGVAKVMLGDDKTGIELFNQALHRLNEMDNPALQAHTLIRRSGAYRMMGDYPRALNDVEQALVIMKAAPGERSLFASAMHSKGMVQNSLGKIGDALEWLIVARNGFLELGDEDSAAKVAMDIAMVYRYLGDLTQAENIYRDTLIYYQNSGNIIWQANLLNNLGVLHALAGEYDTALSELERAIQYAKMGGYSRLEAYALTSLGDLFKDVRAVREAQDAYEKARAVLAQVNDQFLRFYLMLVQSDLSLIREDLAGTEKWLIEAKCIAAEAGSQYEEALCRWMAGRLSLAREAYQAAREDLQSAEAYFSRERHHVEAIRCQLLLLAVYYRLNNFEQFKAHLKRTLPVIRNAEFHNVIANACEPLTKFLDNVSLLDEEIRVSLVPIQNVVRQNEKQLPVVRRQLRRQSVLVPLLPPELTILTLGRIHIAIGDHIITGMEWRQQSARDLMLLLMLNPDGLTKEQVGLCFWPDISPSELKLRFKNTIYRLRHAVNRDVILFDEDIYSFNRSMDYEADFETFNREIQQAGLARKPEQAIKHYRAAIDLYKGDFLLEITEEWALPERDRLRQKYLDALKRLIEQYIDTTQPIDALEIAKRYFREDAINESVHQLVMRIHAGMGNLSAVIYQYQSLSELLERELGVQPSPQTVSLFELLTRNRRRPEMRG